MRGTRVDKLDNGRYRIVHFGNFAAAVPSIEFNMSEKDAFNLTYQLLEKFPDIAQDIKDREDTP